MGTDVHGVFQRRASPDAAWEDVPSEYKQNRHYQLFAVLAGVRNGYGFAEIPTGEPVDPIAPQRGIPTDFEMNDDSHPLKSLEHMDPHQREWHSAEKLLEVWMGDHSHSWLSAAEMLAWYASAPVVLKRGILNREQYDKWDKTPCPESYCGGISGCNVITIPDNAVSRASENWTHINVEWESGLKEELAYFFNEVQRLVKEHGPDVRFVFGFDS